MKNTTVNFSWPENCRRPASNNQPEFFRMKAGEILAELGITADDLLRWSTLGWTEIDGLQDMDWPEQSELQFLRDITQSSLTEAQVGRLLEQLPRPCRFVNPACVAYSFSSGWLEVMPIPETETPDNVWEYIQKLEEDEDRKGLEELRRSIDETLERLANGGKSD